MYKVSIPHDCQARHMDVVMTFFSVQEKIYKEIKKNEWWWKTYDKEHFDWTATISFVEYIDVIVDVGVDEGGWVHFDVPKRGNTLENRYFLKVCCQSFSSFFSLLYFFKLYISYKSRLVICKSSQWSRWRNCFNIIMFIGL